ncbi:NUDIX domain-containing protein [Candidatus Saccharibacteria bacterium]|nr:NUDIX domain-containing protein [Candidatus Saccharibacteria bacterium]
MNQNRPTRRMTPRPARPSRPMRPATGMPKMATVKPKSNGEPVARRALKVPEALPTEQVKESPLKKFTSAVFKKKTAIQEIVREPTSGGIVFRLTADKMDIEVLLIQDSKGRWTIPKGHIEPGETAKMTARREIEEETGLKNFDILTWLGKIHFKYRRADKLVLMTTQIYLVQALDAREMPTAEKWMKGIKWFSFTEALDLIEYDDIEKLMLIAKRKIRSGDF